MDQKRVVNSKELERSVKKEIEREKKEKMELLYRQQQKAKTTHIVCN